ncbi:MAG: hypothetical protein KAG56_09190 [Sulfurovaceae bacterium]|nr:hypothetical protein [Sulfurovaceae bacterium]
MGTCTWSGNSKVYIDKNLHVEALATLKHFHNIKNDNLYVNNKKIIESATLKEALEAWGFFVKEDSDGGLCHFEYVGDKGDFTPLMQVIAPYVRSGSVLEMGMENEGSDFISVFTFKNKVLKIEEFIEYEENYRVLADRKKSSSITIDWYSKQLHFQYEKKMYRIVSWKAIDGVIDKAKKQVEKGLKYGKSSTDFLQWDYAYNEGVLAEEIYQEKSDDKKLILVITRNRYESLCLNTPNVAFIDLDVPKTENNRLQLYKTKIEKKVSQYFDEHTQHSGVLYETAEGMRLVFTHQLISVDNAKKQGFFDFTYCDPLYVKMCIIQECFRARLTPKPWRAEKNKGENLAICRLVKKFNESMSLDHKEINTVLNLHDKYCLSDKASTLV